MTTGIIAKQLLIITGIMLAFYASGYIGMLCEARHFSLAASTAVFGFSFTGISAVFFKLYQIITFYFFN